MFKFKKVPLLQIDKGYQFNFPYISLKFVRSRGLSEEEAILPIISRLFQGFKYLYLGQYIEEDFYLFVNKNHVQNLETLNIPIDYAFSSGFSDDNYPYQTAKEYVLHAIGPNNITWIRPIIKCNMFTGISTVIYGFKRKPKDWLQIVIQDNCDILEHYEDKKITKNMIRGLEVIFYNTDFEYFLLFRSKEFANKAISFIKEISRSSNISIKMID